MTTHEAEDEDAAAFWERFYQERDQVWSGRVNPVLGAVARDLRPGLALDLGCGEGGDALWLAGQGWSVTAVDISTTALDRVQEQAQRAGVGDRVTCEHHDLARSFPSGTFDLVSAQFFQSPVELPWEAVLHAAAQAVALDGVVLVVSHGPFPAGTHHPGPSVRFPTPAEVLAALDLVDAEWTVLECATRERVSERPDGSSMTVTDSVVLARRSGA